MAALTPRTGVEVGVMVLVLLLEVFTEEGGTTNKGEVNGETDLTTTAVAVAEVLIVDCVVPVVMSIGAEQLGESRTDATVVKTCFDLGDKSIGIELFCCSSDIIESDIVVLIIR